MNAPIAEQEQAGRDAASQRVSSGRNAASQRLPFGPAIRVIEVYFVLVMATVLGWALLMPAGDFKYDITLLRIMVVMAMAARSVWLIEQRVDITRPFVIVSMSLVIVISILDMVFGGEYDRIAALVSWPVLIAGGLLYFGGSFAIIAYFAFDPHAKVVFCEPSTHSTRPTHDPDENIYEKPLTWPWIRNLGIYYFTFSIVGHWAEIGFCWLIVLGVVMGDYDFSHAQLWDWWLCPYPAEGIAVVMIALLLFPFKEWVLKKTGGRVVLTLVISFLVNMLVCAAIDFTTGITANANFELWDYRHLPFNFMGQIVLQNTLVYSVAATFIVWVLYPLMAKWLHRMPPRYANGLFIGFAAFYLFLEILYYVHIGPEGLVFG